MGSRAVGAKPTSHHNVHSKIPQLFPQADEPINRFLNKERLLAALSTCLGALALLSRRLGCTRNVFCGEAMYARVGIRLALERHALLLSGWCVAMRW